MSKSHSNGTSEPELANVVDVSTIKTIHAELKETFDAGRTRDLEWRRTQLKQLLKMFAENEADMVTALRQDLGRATTEAWFGDVEIPRLDVEVLLKHLDKWTKPRRVWTNLLNFPSWSGIYRDPLGAVLIIAPWNYPIQLALAPLAGAIAAGNTVLLKPSEVSVHCSNLLCKLIPEYLDPAAIKVVNGGVKESTAILELKWDLIFYTGSGAVGKIIATAAAKHLTPTVLELGGKSPTYVSKHCNLDMAVRRVVFSKFYNAGQTCVAPDYVLVHQDIKEEFLKKMKETITQFYGEDPSKSESYARIINSKHTERLAKTLEPQKGVTPFKTLIGGQVDISKKFVAPTVLVDVKPEHKIMEDEIFGPILPVLTVNSKEDFAKYVQARDKPLALYIFSSDNAEVEWILKNTTSGGAGINDAVMHLTNPQLPFGGVGPSGHGAYHGEASIKAFSHEKSVLWRPSSGLTDVSQRYPPYDDTKISFMKRITAIETWWS